MSKEIIGAIGIIIGGIITGLFSWLSSREEKSVDAEVQFQKDILARLNVLERQQKELEHVVMTWKGRYWSLYIWLVNFCLTNGITAYPPSFHEMKYEDMEDQFTQKGKSYEDSKNDN